MSAFSFAEVLFGPMFGIPVAITVHSEACAALSCLSTEFISTWIAA